MNNERFSIRKRIKSFGYAFAGLKVLFKEEHNSWIHAVAAVCAVVAGIDHGMDSHNNSDSHGSFGRDNKLVVGTHR